MALALHLIFAFGSMGFATYVFIKPSKSGLFTAYTLVFSTLISGFYLVLSKPANILEVCTMGLLYLGFVSFAIVSARNKLARAVSKN